jgi:Cft2 family RNA processing exonuclease
MAKACGIGDVDVELAPAGHILGSAQAVLAYKGQRIVVSGDFKRRPDPTCPPFEPIPCDVFITEATFALPVFHHPSDMGEIGKLLRSVATFPNVRTWWASTPSASASASSSFCAPPAGTSGSGCTVP